MSNITEKLANEIVTVMICTDALPGMWWPMSVYDFLSEPYEVAHECAEVIVFAAGLEELCED